MRLPASEHRRLLLQPDTYLAATLILAAHASVPRPADARPAFLGREHVDRKRRKAKARRQARKIDRNAR